MTLTQQVESMQSEWETLQELNYEEYEEALEYWADDEEEEKILEIIIEYQPHVDMITVDPLEEMRLKEINRREKGVELPF